MGKFNKISSGIQNSIAEQFYRIGFLVSTHRWKTIAFTVILLGICFSGFSQFRVERNPLELWIPIDSKFLVTTKWLLNNLEIGFRREKILITGPNILEIKNLHKILKIHNHVTKLSAKLNNGTEVNWNNVCLKIPYIAEIDNKLNIRRKRQISNNDNDDEFSNLFDEADSLTGTPKREFNPSVDLPVPIYCKLINDLPWGCYEKNLLDLWKYDEKNLENISTTYDIFRKLRNTTTINPISGHETNYKEQLSGITTDINGNIISAKAILIEWLVKLNFTLVRTQQLGNLAGTEDWTTEEVSVWEDVFLHKIEELKLELEDGDFTIFYSAGKSFGDISYRTMFKDTDKLSIGIIMMSIYIMIVLSKFSWIEFRFTLAGVGLLSVGLAFLSTCGICFYLGIPYGPVHTSLPFLLMGLGVDDMFVLMACWRQVKFDNSPIEERIGKMLKLAGASITVTSLTDVIAFVVGSFTVIPSLQSFCLYAAVGVFMTYIFAITFYIAVFTLDEYRIAGKRNALLPCIKHSDEKNMKLCCDLNLMHKSLKYIYSNFILTKPGKILIILIVIGLTALSGQNLRNLEQKFDPNWFIPETTYLSKYISEAKRYFPETEYQGSIFMGNLNYTQSISRIADLVTDIENNKNFSHIQSWVKPFLIFVKKYYYIDLNKTIIDDFNFRFYLSKFLQTPNGGKFQANFHFKTTLQCGHPVPDIIASWIDFRFKKFDSRNEYLPFMKNLDELVKSKNFSESGDGFAEVWSKEYANWITDEIIDREVYRNIILALICVMFCTYAVIINFKVCFLIFICVLLTLVNVGGFMQMWGLTIDLVSCIGLQLAVGLCVDHAAHIGHTFLICSDGDRNKRVLDTILHIGAAVLYGGGSTLLSLLLLSQSESYTFKAFFKIFFLVIVFGLFHGVVLLPVILSLVGPSPYNKSERTINDIDDVIKNLEELKPMTNNVTTVVLNLKEEDRLAQNEQN